MDPQVQEGLIRLLSLLGEDELEFVAEVDPTLYMEIVEVSQILTSAQQPIPDKMAEDLMQIEDKKQRFLAAVEAFKVRDSGQLPVLAEAMRAQGLLKTAKDYLQRAVEGVALIAPVTVNGKTLRFCGIDSHVTLRVFQDMTPEAVVELVGKFDLPSHAQHDWNARPSSLVSKLGNFYHILSLTAPEPWRALVEDPEIQKLPGGYPAFKPHVTITYEDLAAAGDRPLVQVGALEIRKGLDPIYRLGPAGWVKL